MLATALILFAVASEPLVALALAIFTLSGTWGLATKTRSN